MTERRSEKRSESQRFEAWLGRAIAGYVDRVRQKAGLVLSVYVVATLLLGAYAATHLQINSDPDALFAEDVPQRALVQEMGKTFPVLLDSMLVVVDGPSQAAVGRATEKLAKAFREREDLFLHVFAPSTEPFFRKNGLLYSSVDDLDSFADQLAKVQPYLGELTRDPSLRGFFDLIQLTLKEGGSLATTELDPMMGQVSESIDAATRGASVPFAWDETIAGKSLGKLDRRQVIILQPRLDESSLQPAEPSISFVRENARAIEADEGGAGVRIRTTGEVVLMHDDMQAVDRKIGSIIALSLGLVTLVLFYALRSWRLNIAVLTTLLMGVVQTAGFAAWAVGALNIISSTFGVLIIGLTVDFGLHFAMTYQRRIDEGFSHEDALYRTGEMVGT